MPAGEIDKQIPLKSQYVNIPYVAEIQAAMVTPP